MKKELLTLSICLLLLIISFSGCVEESVSAEEIKERFLQAVEEITSYKYTANSTIARTKTNETGSISEINGQINYNCTIDSSNKRWRVDMIAFANETQEIHLYQEMNMTMAIYFENDTLYFPWGNLTWRPSIRGTHGNDWYAYALLERQAYFILEDAGLERLDDEVIDGDDCYVLNLTPVIGNIVLTNTSTDSIFPTGVSENNFLEVKIVYWINKETNLLKKIYIKFIYNLSLSFDGGEIWDHETELVFYDYNSDADVEAPWQSYLDEAEASLGHLDYINVDDGYGFNLPDGWTIERDPYGSYDGVTVYRDIFYLENYSSSNLSVYMGVSSFDGQNFSSMINDRIEDFSDSPYYENLSMSHGGITINEMNTYKIVYTYVGSNASIEELFIEKDERFLSINIYGETDLFNSHVSDIEQSLNSSLVIISPYFSIEYW